MKYCEVCKEKFPSLDKHHIRSKSKGGTNNKWNIANICPNCHRRVHINDIILEGKFMSSDGIILVWRKNNEDKIMKHINDPSVFIHNKS